MYMFLFLMPSLICMRNLEIVEEKKLEYDIREIVP